MDTFLHSAWWGPIGLLSTLIFGFLSIYIVIKNWYPCRITYITAQIIELFDAVGNTLDGLDVNYKGNSIDQNLVLLNGVFLNSGKKDITKDMIDSPIEISLPKNYKWLTAKIIQNRVEANINIKDQNTIEIATGLFRKGEYVRFNALIQVPSEDSSKSLTSRLKSALKFDHRISNTHKIKTDTIQNKDYHLRIIKKRCTLIATTLLIAGAMAVFYTYKGIPQVIHYPYIINNATEEVIIETESTGNTIKIKSTQSNFEQEIEFEHFIRDNRGTPTLGKAHEERRTTMTILISIQFLMPIILLVMILYDFFSNRRKLKIIDEL